MDGPHAPMPIARPRSLSFSLIMVRYFGSTRMPAETIAASHAMNATDMQTHSEAEEVLIYFNDASKAISKFGGTIY